MTITLGTTSEQKIGYLKEVLSELRIEAQLIPHEVSSGISEQPLTSEETRQGSINRATRALELADEAHCSLGIEVGYHPNILGDFEMFCWATIIDRSGTTVSQQSHTFLLPKFHQDILKTKGYLGDHVSEYSKTSDDFIVQHIAEIAQGRKPFIMNAVYHVLLRYLARREF